MRSEQTKIVRDVKLFPSRREGATVARKIFLHSVGSCAAAAIHHGIVYSLPTSNTEGNIPMAFWIRFSLHRLHHHSTNRDPSSPRYFLCDAHTFFTGHCPFLGFRTSRIDTVLHHYQIFRSKTILKFDFSLDAA
jgi:hypothetical protein